MWPNLPSYEAAGLEQPESAKFIPPLMPKLLRSLEGDDWLEDRAPKCVNGMLSSVRGRRDELLEIGPLH